MSTLPLTLPGFEIQQIARREMLLIITGRATSPTAICPCCQQVSSRVHSYYTRSPQDLPISGQEVQFVLAVRRFRCQNRGCRQKTFAERLSALPVSARQTARLGTVLDAIAVALSGQAGSRLSEQLALPVSPDTLLRRAKRAMPASRPTPRILGVDDFAFRRGHTYGTLLLDLETHQPVDLLEDRRAETIALVAQTTSWGGNHQPRSLERVSTWGNRRRSTGPSRVIDRWHVLKNLRETIERFLSHTQMPEEIQEGARRATSPRQKRTSGEQARSQGSRQRRLALYEKVVALSKLGGSIQGIARQRSVQPTNRSHVPSSPQFS